MAPSLYATLPANTFSIRLIKLQPSQERLAPILCKLVTYPIDRKRSGSHSYECLSYVWGTEEYRKTIEIDTGDAVAPFQVTPNLYQALLHLRDPFFEQILWIDAICINQGDEEEKATQVSAMARIYGLAKRVVVWLGAEADDSTFAFQKLRDLAQPRPSAARSSHDTDCEASFSYGEDGHGTEQAIQILFKRPYFRRMWILQEITAARNILFKCGDAELQTATFVTGVDALKPLDDWRLRNRMRAFLLLIQSSAHRENLKGQTHLNIEPLTALIDRFHTHHAKDPRDKIYALWGLCSDSDAMSQLQPNYSKSWATVFGKLGTIIFGDGSRIAASANRQLMFVRTTAYDVGKVGQIHATYGPLWEDTQDIEVISARASRSVGNDDAWAVRMKIRVPTEQLMEDDWVLFLQHTNKIVFARPTKYYLKVIITIDSRTVLVHGPDSNVSHSSRRSWQRPSWLYDIDEEAKEYPLLWNWENDSEHNEEASLKLMADHVADSTVVTDPDRAQVLLRAKAISDMAALFMHWQDYHEASELLAETVIMYSSAYGPEHEITVANRDGLDEALSQKNTYVKARELLLDSANTKRELFSHRAHMGLDDFVRDLCALAISLSARITSNKDSDPPVPTHILVDLASKVMSKGVSKELILQALQCFPFPKGTTIDATSDGLPPELCRVHILQDGAPVQDYLRFLLVLAGDDIYISAMEMLTAARRQLGYSILILLATRSDYPLRKVPEILEAMRVRRTPGMYLRSFVKELGDRIVITSDAINVAAKWDIEALSTLLEAAKGAPVVAPVAFTNAMQNLSASTPAIVGLLAQHAGCCAVPEHTVQLIAWSDQFPKTELQRIFVSLLEHTNLIIQVPERVAFATKSGPSGLEVVENNVTELLRFRPDSHLFSSIAMKGLSTTKSFMDRMQSTGPIRQDTIDNIAANDIIGYASFINLVRYRKGEFAITADLIRRVARTIEDDASKTRLGASGDLKARKGNARGSTWLYGEDEAPWNALLVIDRCTAFLIRHADVRVITSLASTPEMVNTAASRGLFRVIEDFQTRLEESTPHCRTSLQRDNSLLQGDVVQRDARLQLNSLRLIAELCHQLQRPLHPGEALVDMPKITSLIRSLAGAGYDSVPITVKWELYLLACDKRHDGTIITLMIQNGLMNSDTVSKWEEVRKAHNGHQPRTIYNSNGLSSKREWDAEAKESLLASLQEADTQAGHQKAI